MVENKLIDQMTDLEFVDHWIDKCSDFINPILYRELKDRGLAHIVNKLQGDMAERRAIARARMAQDGFYIGEPQIEEIAGHIGRIKAIRGAIFATEVTDVLNTLKLVDELRHHLEFVRDYFKESQSPA